jgi:hypothetical protein
MTWMTDAGRNWQEIANKLAKEPDAKKRRKLQHDLRAALERAGFQNFSRINESLPLGENEHYSEES